MTKQLAPIIDKAHPTRCAGFNQLAQARYYRWAILQFLSFAQKGFSDVELQAEMHVDPQTLGEFKSALATLTHDGEIRAQGGRIELSPRRRLVGAFQWITEKGGIVTEQDGSGRSAYVGADFANGAMTGDEVEVRLRDNGTRRNGSNLRPVGRVERIQHRFDGPILGRSQREGNSLRVVTDRIHYRSEMLLDPRTEPDVLGGRRVVLEIQDYPGNGNPLRARIAEDLGDVSQIETEVRAAILAYGLDTEFSADVLRNADELQRNHNRNVNRRFDGCVDLTHLKTATIDSPGARAFDDAFSIRQVDGKREILIHLACPSAIIPIDSAVALGARSRGSAVYFPKTMLPMFPDSLASLASLQKGKRRRALTVTLTLDGDSHLEATRIQRSIVRSDARLTYEEAESLFASRLGSARRNSRCRNEYDGELFQLLNKLREAALQFDESGRKRGELNLRVDSTTPEGGRRDLVSQNVVETLMRLANVKIAEIMDELDVPALWRILPPPDVAARDHLAARLGGLGVSFPRNSDRLDYQRVLSETLGTEVQDDVHYSVLRSLPVAAYSPAKIQHWALATLYVHATSALRRYADFATQHLLERILDGAGGTIKHDAQSGLGDEIGSLRQNLAHDGDDLFSLCDHLNKKEDDIKTAARQIRNRKKG